MCRQFDSGPRHHYVWLVDARNDALVGVGWASHTHLVIDELRYLPVDQASANWIFQVVSRPNDKGSIVLMGNSCFGDWGQVFANPVVGRSHH